MEKKVKSGSAKKSAEAQSSGNQKSSRKKISIALQGGGAHGAFAWGVMDALLEDDRFEIEGMSGTSAGGMNSAAIIQGLVEGGNENAREKLSQYWLEMHELSKKISPFSLDPISKAMGNYNLNHSMGYQIMGMLQEHFSPYDLNPLNKNPFGDFVSGFFNFDLVRNQKEKKLFLGATHVKTGKIRIFKNEDFSPEALMASACLPSLFHAVEVQGEYYWDGGYIANPAIFPLIYECEANDIILIQLTKSQRDDIPHNKFEIVDRLKEITYNGCLLREMRAIYTITKFIDAGFLRTDGGIKRINMHLIKDESVFENLNLSSALNTDWDFLTMLFEAGRNTAKQWIEENYDGVGSKTTIDEELFEDFM